MNRPTPVRDEVIYLGNDVICLPWQTNQQEASMSKIEGVPPDGSPVRDTPPLGSPVRDTPPLEIRDIPPREPLPWIEPQTKNREDFNDGSADA